MGRLVAALASIVGVLVWGAFAVGITMWGIGAEASYALQTGAPQQAAVAAYTASGSIIAYTLTRAITSILQLLTDEARAWGEPQKRRETVPDIDE